MVADSRTIWLRTTARIAVLLVLFAPGIALLIVAEDGALAVVYVSAATLLIGCAAHLLAILSTAALAGLPAAIAAGVALGSLLPGSLPAGLMAGALGGALVQLMLSPMILSLPALPVAGVALALSGVAERLLSLLFLVSAADTSGPDDQALGLWLGLAIAAPLVCLVVTYRLDSSFWATALRSWRISPATAAARGVDAVRIALPAIAAVGAMAGFAGGLLAAMPHIVPGPAMGLYIAGAALIAGGRSLATLILVLACLWMLPEIVAGYAPEVADMRPVLFAAAGLFLIFMQPPKALGFGDPALRPEARF
ncbi:MAG: hypothetical protein ACFB6S_06155 [Geminicoccaceae bacterium]